MMAMSRRKTLAEARNSEDGGPVLRRTLTATDVSWFNSCLLVVASVIDPVNGFRCCVFALLDPPDSQWFSITLTATAVSYFLLWLDWNRWNLIK